MVIFTSIFVNSCVEEYTPTTESFERILVVEGVLTDENKKQEIKLSRTFQFEEQSPAREENAVVIIKDDQNNEYLFEETKPGTYSSEIAFNAQPNISYTLNIKTSNGDVYTSAPELLTERAEIEDMYAEALTNDDGEIGIGVFLDAYDPSGSVKYYRYEYEETHKIIAPKWVDQDMIVVSEFPPEVALVPKSKEEKTCFATNSSKKNILKSGDGLNANSIEKIPIRFISLTDYIVANRYSILVKQYSLSREAYGYYKNMNNFSGSQSLFSQVQPGFIQGNIVSENKDNSVIGYFNVSAVTTSERIFFNYKDFYPNSTPPPFPSDCFFLTPYPFRLVDALLHDRVKYYGDNLCLTPEPPPYCSESMGDDEGPYSVVARACGDCTAMGTNVVPEFWED